MDHIDGAHACSEFQGDDVPDRWSASTEMADAVAELVILIFAAVAVFSFIAVVLP